MSTSINDDFKSGFVCLVGRPNAGKSTLLNACCGKDFAITSNVAQTTRKRFRAVITREDTQIVIVDTPGIHKPKDALGDELNKQALSDVGDVEVIAFLIDAQKEVGRGDEWIAQRIAKSSAKKILVMTKADLVSPQAMQKQIDAAYKLVDFDDVCVVSAKEHFNVDSFLYTVAKYLPYGPKWFSDDMQTDALDEDFVCEFVREQVFRLCKDEIPHSCGVVCDQFSWRKNNQLSIRATIMVEREGQKGIIIGKSGQMLKRIGIGARKRLEKFFDAKVYLDLRVEVRRQWRKDPEEIKRLGYSEE